MNHATAFFIVAIFFVTQGKSCDYPIANLKTSTFENSTVILRVLIPMSMSFIRASVGSNDSFFGYPRQDWRLDELRAMKDFRELEGRIALNQFPDREFQKYSPTFFTKLNLEFSNCSQSLPIVIIFSSRHRAMIRYVEENPDVCSFCKVLGGDQIGTVELQSQMQGSMQTLVSISGNMTIDLPWCFSNHYEPNVIAISPQTITSDAIFQHGPCLSNSWTLSFTIDHSQCLSESAYSIVIPIYEQEFPFRTGMLPFSFEIDQEDCMTVIVGEEIVSLPGDLTLIHSTKDGIFLHSTPSVGSEINMLITMNSSHYIKELTIDSVWVYFRGVDQRADAFLKNVTFVEQHQLLFTVRLDPILFPRESFDIEDVGITVLLKGKFDKDAAILEDQITYTFYTSFMVRPFTCSGELSANHIYPGSFSLLDCPHGTGFGTMEVYCDWNGWNLAKSFIRCANNTFIGIPHEENMANVIEMGAILLAAIAAFFLCLAAFAGGRYLRAQTAEHFNVTYEGNIYLRAMAEKNRKRSPSARLSTDINDVYMCGERISIRERSRDPKRGSVLSLSGGVEYEHHGKRSSIVSLNAEPEHDKKQGKRGSLLSLRNAISSFSKFGGGRPSATVSISRSARVSARSSDTSTATSSVTMIELHGAKNAKVHITESMSISRSRSLKPKTSLSLVEKRDPVLDDNSDDSDNNVGMIPKIGRYFSVPVAGASPPLYTNKSEPYLRNLHHFGKKRLTEPDIRNLYLYE